MKLKTFKDILGKLEESWESLPEHRDEDILNELRHFITAFAGGKRMETHAIRFDEFSQVTLRTLLDRIKRIHPSVPVDFEIKKSERGLNVTMTVMGELVPEVEDPTARFLIHHAERFVRAFYEIHTGTGACIICGASSSKHHNDDCEAFEAKKLADALNSYASRE